MTARTVTITITDFLADLRRRGVRLRWDTTTGELEVRAPAGVLTDRDRRLLVLLKAGIITALAAGVDSDVADDSAAAVNGSDDGEPPPWRCRCGSHVSGLLQRCPTCLRQRDGRPSPCLVCGAAVVRRPPPPRDVSLRTPWGQEPVGAGPALEPFCAHHRRGAHVLHVAAARGWPAFTVSDGTTIAAGKPAWLTAVQEHADDVWYGRVLVELGPLPPSPSPSPSSPSPSPSPSPSSSPSSSPSPPSSPPSSPLAPSPPPPAPTMEGGGGGGGGGGDAPVADGHPDDHGTSTGTGTSISTSNDDDHDHNRHGDAAPAAHRRGRGRPFRGGCLRSRQFQFPFPFQFGPWPWVWSRPWTWAWSRPGPCACLRPRPRPRPWPRELPPPPPPPPPPTPA